MPDPSEIDVLRSIDDLLSGLSDGAARDRVLRWAWGKFSSAPLPVSNNHAGSEPATTTKRPARSMRSGKASKKATTAQPKKSKSRNSITLVKDLNLKPKGKKSFSSVVEEKKPNSNSEKCTLAVYYLKHEASIDPISVSHVYTCFKSEKWRIPSDFSNALAITASRHGWLDTKDMESIQLTTHGENLVEHDLPASKTTK